MGMQFTLTLTGDLSTEAEASDLGIGIDNVGELIGCYNSDVEFDDARAEGTVTLTARVTVRNVEVAASDMANYDAEESLKEAIDPYGSPDISDADFDITDAPTGFDEVVAAVGYDRDVAIAVYAALDSAGYSVNY